VETGHQEIRGGGQLTEPAGPVSLARLHLRLGALNELQYRVNFWVQLFNSGLNLATGLIAIAVVYNQTDTLGGWSSSELLAVLGVHVLIGGFLRTFVVPNMWSLIRDVQEGTLDYTLTRPADSQLIVSVRQINIWNLIDVVLGAGVVVWALREMQSQLPASGLLAFGVALVCGAAIVYAIWLTAVTIAFKAVDVGDLMQILNGVYEAGRWPVSIYPLWLRSSLTVVIPLAFAITVPAEIVSGRVEWWWLAVAVAVACLALLASRAIWKWGIRNYSGASA
jgi:ABC-2 type transport system permease protein